MSISPNTFQIYIFSKIYLPVAPQILPFEFGEVPINSGELTSLTCSVSKGDLPIDLNWLHNNKSIELTHGISVMRMNKKVITLSIDSANEEHVGEYSCIAKNKAGETKYSAMLHVNGI